MHFFSSYELGSSDSSYSDFCLDLSSFSVSVSASSSLDSSTLFKRKGSKSNSNGSLIPSNSEGGGLNLPLVINSGCGGEYCGSNSIFGTSGGLITLVIPLECIVGGLLVPFAKRAAVVVRRPLLCAGCSS